MGEDVYKRQRLSNFPALRSLPASLDCLSAHWQIRLPGRYKYTHPESRRFPSVISPAAWIPIAAFVTPPRLPAERLLDGHNHSRVFDESSDNPWLLKELVRQTILFFATILFPPVFP